MQGRILTRIAEPCFARVAFIIAFAAVILPLAACAQGAGKQVLRGHVPPTIARFHLQPLRDLPATNRLHLAIGLPLRNQAALDRLLAEIYDPASTNYHRYLTPEQFTERFGPSEQDYQALIAFANANGLTVTATHPNRALLDVSGSVATVEKVFHVNLRVYRHPTEGRDFYAPDTEPSVDFNLPISHVSGLDNFFIPRPANLKKNPLKNSPAGVLPASGSGPSGNYMGNDFRAAYVPGSRLNGAGQIVGLLELDGYYTNDITSYESQAGLPNLTVTNIYIDGYGGAAGGNNVEVALDIEMAVAMATNLSAVVVYEEQNGGVIVDMLNRMANDNLAKQISSSWLIGDSAGYDTAYKQMASQGQSFFQASGDDGAYYSGIGQWADDTNITLVGGTTLYTTGPGGPWSAETTWNWLITAPPNSAATGGGITFNGVPIPGYQVGLIMTTNQGSTSLRNSPDVALTADNIFVVADNGQQEPGTGGTSAAAPLWAGFCALMNQQALEAGRPVVGFLNPAVYAIGKGTNYNLAFHDITTGNNTNATVGNKWFAVPGYDLCTGWGTPTGTNLVNALAGPPDPLGIMPLAGFSASGPKNGPFSQTSQSLTFTNSGTNSLNWSAGNPPSWLSVSPASGALAAGGQATVTVGFNSASSNLTQGIYGADLWFTNQGSGGVQLRRFFLLVTPSFVVAPGTGFTSAGPVSGPFSVTCQIFLLTNFTQVPLTWSLINTSVWLTASSGGGTLPGGGVTNMTVCLASAATNLPTGTFVGNAWFTNQTGGGAQARQFTLLVNQSLVQNGGFEAGNLSGWTLSNDGYSLVDSGGTSHITPHGGSFLAALGDFGTLGLLSQTLSTVPNQPYLLSLWLNSPTVGGGNLPNEFSVSWNGGTLFDQVNIPPITGWTNMQFIVTATGSSTVLQFGERVDPWYLGLDDVSVVPVPQSVLQSAMKTNNNLKFSWNAMSNLVYQVQFKTNLLQTNWIVLKAITATNTAATFTDTNPITGTPQKFYRLLVLP